eukprot:TRINITY_DN76811_c0_g1_i1.p1 TRINITY_DN76811_c0_g1~~TRINITY_DN76811_c0_g1_i1.p1  ORF type:complete len:384 (+),score=104.46 TRINITY_DN76811_c0_g1_i1:85-1236(+)
MTALAPTTESFMPFPGQAAEIAAPRDRSPSPVRKAVEDADKNGPLPAREFDIDFSQVDIVYAEDEEVFRETAVREFLKVGFQRPNIHEAENGLGALDHIARLQNCGNVTMPLFVLLDIRMPDMDGKECALRIQELVMKQALQRQPFVVCISSIHRQVIVEEGKGNFQVVLPKPFTQEMLSQTLDLMRKWWTMGVSRKMPAWKTFSAELIDLIVADEEPVCQLHCITAFQQGGVLSQSITEVDSQEELVEALEADTGGMDRPLILLLGNAHWAEGLRGFAEDARAQGKREPFVVCTSVDSERISNTPSGKNFHAFMPQSFALKDVEWCLDYCRAWFLSKGDGKDAEEDWEGDDDEDDHDGGLSEASDLEEVDEEDEDEEEEEDH